MYAQRSQGRFSEGQELVDTPEKERVGRFSDGEEQLPDTPEKERVGTFGEGVRQVAD